MTTQFNTAFDVHVDIYNTKKLYDKKKEEYNKLLELNQTYHNEEKNLQNNIDEIKIQIKSLDNLVSFGETTNYIITQCMKNDYTHKYDILYDDLISTKFHIANIENEIYKLNIEFNAFNVYIDNLYKMIPRINRWSKINNQTQHELENELYSNSYIFKTQLSIIDFLPPQ